MGCPVSVTAGNAGTPSHADATASVQPAQPPIPKIATPDTTWNTRYLDAIVESLRGSGQPVRDEDAVRLSPLGHAHVNCLGRYAFTTQPPAELRPLRDPNARDGEDDGEF
jgi:hypothetical protein